MPRLQLMALQPFNYREEPQHTGGNTPPWRCNEIPEFVAGDALSNNPLPRGETEAKWCQVVHVVESLAG